MKTYLIRIAGDNSGSVLGMVRARSVDWLFDVMDQYSNPCDFEYLQLTDECVFLRGTDESDDYFLNDGVRDQIPATDAELAVCEEDGEVPAKTRHRWKTMVELCGGAQKFWEVYEQVMGPGSRSVARLIRNFPDNLVAEGL